mgnify:CR=1 FL=1|jgi:hypothetical protein
MARTANLVLENTTITVEFVKVDRRKLYGWTKLDIVDDNNNICSVASIADGHHILPSKSTTLVGFNEKNEYVSRSTLIGVDTDNKKVEKVPSIYDVPSSLEESTLDDYLSLNVKSVYQLNVSEGKDILLSKLASGNVYSFFFNYRADYEADDAFLIESNGNIFAVIGNKAHIEFIGLENKEEEIVDIVDEGQTEEDEFDFGML